MAWFVGRSVIVIVLAFVLGLVVGWLWWRRRKVRFGESQALARLTGAHQARTDELTRTLARKDDELRAKDDEIARLRAELEPSAAAPVAEGVSSGSATWRGGAGAATDADSAATGAATSDSAPDSTADSTADSSDATSDQDVVFDIEAEPDLVTTPSDPSPATLAALATPVEEIRTEEHETPAIPEPSAVPAAETVTVAEAVPAAEVAEATGTGTGTGPAVDDDLERIEGIGPRIGAALRGAGIHTFRQLADADTATLQSALEQAGLRFAPSLPTWSRQARFLADGDEAGFHALTQQLVGGRDVSGAK